MVQDYVSLTSRHTPDPMWKSWRPGSQTTNVTKLDPQTDLIGPSRLQQGDHYNFFKEHGRQLAVTHMLGKLLAMDDEKKRTTLSRVVVTNRYPEMCASYGFDPSKVLGEQWEPVVEDEHREEVDASAALDAEADRMGLHVVSGNLPGSSDDNGEDVDPNQFVETEAQKPTANGRGVVDGASGAVDNEGDPDSSGAATGNDSLEDGDVVPDDAGSNGIGGEGVGVADGVSSLEEPQDVVDAQDAEMAADAEEIPPADDVPPADPPIGRTATNMDGRTTKGAEEGVSVEAQDETARVEMEIAATKRPTELAGKTPEPKKLRKPTVPEVMAAREQVKAKLEIEYNDLLHKMLRMDKEQRISPDEALRHEFFTTLQNMHPETFAHNFAEKFARTRRSTGGAR
eukprot:g13034.t1